MNAAKDARPLIVHVVYRFGVGGLENGVVNLINHMPAERWRHAVVALTEVEPAFASRLTRRDVQCISLHKPPGQGVWQYVRLYRLYKTLHPAVVHTRNLGTLEFQLPAWLAGVRVRVHGEHGRDAEDVYGTNRRHIWTRRLYRHFVHHQIALGSELANYLRAAIGIPPERLTPILNGVDHLRFTPAPARAAIVGCPFDDPALWLVGTVGRMQTVKAQVVLARAFIDVLRRQPSWRRHLRLVMVGDGPLRQECAALLRDAGMADLAWLPGERSDVPEIMRGLNCFVLPSLVEGISNTILEAMASGLPVLATQVGGNADLVESGVTGVLVPAGDVAALSSGLIRMASNPVSARAMGVAGRQSVERKFSLPAMVAAYELVYEGLLRRGNQE